MVQKETNREQATKVSMRKRRKHRSPRRRRGAAMLAENETTTVGSLSRSSVTA